MSDPISTTPDLHEDAPEEWQVLEHSGTGDRLLIVEWDAVSETIRVSGPVVEIDPPVRPF